MRKPADSSAPLADLITERWSPRALDETGEVTWDQLRALLEAARWAPSFGNTQPARYLVGRRGDETFRRILGALTPRNQSWAHRAGALLVAVMVTRNEKGEIPYAEYGLGLAGQNLVLQAVAEGLVAHQMAGFDPDTVRREFAVPEEAVPRVAIAVGVQAAPEVFDDERDAERERAPRRRIALGEFAYTGAWGQAAF
ncbi:nitroreductase family protein [Amycolatopsis acidiphila]|uniref:Nitroreductase n=1 Tax=Amycolatopsis acidiphila TaxID=715473 RepID=A0A557ZTR4_9PSEU|nr:nitroreductase family protein [Amycolatopsis acidiphila]TVT15407.1 nitroreductase [Amycolatopsis acidiphila]UIJ59526.1 nitroreductase family protein [Amycolatopsis acidiphila]GHG80425.1 nitroreductase [Amycolatopsis acidiphila]